MAVVIAITAPVNVAANRCRTSVELTDATRLGSTLGIGHAVCQLAAGHSGQHVWGNAQGLLAIWS